MIDRLNNFVVSAKYACTEYLVISTYVFVPNVSSIIVAVEIRKNLKEISKYFV